MYIINSSCLVPAATYETGSIVSIKYGCTSNSFLLSELMSSGTYLCLCQKPVVERDNFTESPNAYWLAFSKNVAFYRWAKDSSISFRCLSPFLITFSTVWCGFCPVPFLHFLSSWSGDKPHVSDICSAYKGKCFGGSLCVKFSARKGESVLCIYTVYVIHGSYLK